MARTIIRPATVHGATTVAASPPVIMPKRMAANVPASMRALPAASSRVSRCSGKMPYLIGPNRADRAPVRASAVISRGTEDSAKPAPAMAATAISQSFRRRVIRALSYLSAISPPSAERKKKGR
jgi:hypothetical protein